MKKIIALSSVVILACLCIAAEGHKPKHEVVVLQASPTFSGNSYAGFIVFNASFSKGVDPIPLWDWTNNSTTNLVQYAQLLADLLDQGFVIQSIVPPSEWNYYQTVILVK